MRSKYIIFRFYDSDFRIDARDVITKIFEDNIFKVAYWNAPACITKGMTFDQSWDKFENFIQTHYKGDVSKFANRISIILPVHHIIYDHIFWADRDNIAFGNKTYDNEGIVQEIKAYLLPSSSIPCDIHFGDEWDRDEDCDLSSIYLDMHTGLLRVY